LEGEEKRGFGNAAKVTGRLPSGNKKKDVNRLAAIHIQFVELN